MQGRIPTTLPAMTEPQVLSSVPWTPGLEATDAGRGQVSGHPNSGCPVAPGKLTVSQHRVWLKWVVGTRESGYHLHPSVCEMLGNWK